MAEVVAVTARRLLRFQCREFDVRADGSGSSRSSAETPGGRATQPTRAHHGRLRERRRNGATRPPLVAPRPAPVDANSASFLEGVSVGPIELLPVSIAIYYANEDADVETDALTDRRRNA